MLESGAMTYHTYCRIVGHIIIVAILSVPLLYSLIKMEIVRYHNSKTEIEVFAKLRFRYATIWNTIFIMLYGILGTVFDVKSLQNKDSDIPIKYRNYRHTFFAGIIFPISTSVLLFWPVFYYDRELIYREVYDEVIPFEINYLVHALVFVYSVWELVFQPRHFPRKDNTTWYHVNVFNLIYLAVVFFTRYVDLGVWMYDILEVTSGTVMFPVWLFSVWGMCLLGYHVQWWLKDFVWWCRDMSVNRTIENGGQKVK